MKKHLFLKGLIAISLIFSADLMAGKSKKKKKSHSPAVVARKAPNPPKEKMALLRKE